MKNKIQKWLISLLTVLVAVLLITTIVFGVKWKQVKDELKDFKAILTLNIDTDGDKDFKPEYTFTFTDYLAGKSLDEILNKDLPDKCPFKFNISKGFLNSITTPKETITNKFGTNNSGTSWLIYSSTSSQVMDPMSKDKEKETSVGLKDLLMGPTNEFTFSYRSISW